MFTRNYGPGWTLTAAKGGDPTISLTPALESIATEIHETAVEKGFWERMWDDEKYMTKLALVHSEVTEVLEAVRKEQGAEKEVEEIADAIIRLLDYYAARRNQGHLGGHWLGDVLQSKMNKNAKRPHKHNNRF